MTPPSTSDVHSAHDVRRVKMWSDTIGRQAKWPINGARKAVARYRVNDREQIPLGQQSIRLALAALLVTVDTRCIAREYTAVYARCGLSARAIHHCLVLAYQKSARSTLPQRHVSFSQCVESGAVPTERQRAATTATGECTITCTVHRSSSRTGDTVP